MPRVAARLAGPGCPRVRIDQRVHAHRPLGVAQRGAQVCHPPWASRAERIGDGAHGSERREKEHLGVRAAAEERRNAARHRRVAAPSLGAAYLQAIGRWLGVTRYTTWALHGPAMRDPQQAIYLTCGSSTPSTGGSPCTAVLLALTERPVAIATYRQALSQCSKFDQSDVS